MLPDRSSAPGGDEGGRRAVPLDADQLVTETASAVWRLHAHLIGRADADDLTQDTFVRVLSALPSFRGDSAPRTWVLSIASRVAADAIRKRQRHRRLLGRLAPPPASPDHAGEHDLLVLLRELPVERRQAFVLTQILELGYAEAAVILDCPIGTVRSRVSRARAQLLAALMADQAGEPDQAARPS